MKKKLAILMFCLVIFIMQSGCYYKSNKTVYANYNQIEYLFTKHNDHPERAMVDLINSSNKKLDIAIYTITQKDIVKAVISAKRRGVDVRIITDKQESSSKGELMALSEFKDNNIPVKINTHDGLMHMKVTISDDKIFTAGSYNYTAQASTKNDEVLLIVNNSKAALDFEKQFNSMWNDNDNFTYYQSPF